MSTQSRMMVTNPDEIALADLPSDRTNAHQRSSLGPGNHRENSAAAPANNVSNSTTDSNTVQDSGGVNSSSNTSQREWWRNVFCCHGRRSRTDSSVGDSIAGNTAGGGSGGSSQNPSQNPTGAAGTGSSRSLKSILKRSRGDNHQEYREGDTSITEAESNLLPPPPPPMTPRVPASSPGLVE